MATDTKTQSPSDAELTECYKAANGEDVGKAQPLTTQRIFRAMRAAIALWGAPATVGEPVAWVVGDRVTSDFHHGIPATITALREGGGFDYVLDEAHDLGPRHGQITSGSAYDSTGWRKAPQIPDLTALTERGKEALVEGRVPLTEEQVAEACGWKAGMACKPLPRELRIARAIEAAHGITSKEGGPKC